MSTALLALSAVTFLAAAFAYYHGAFRTACTSGLAFWCTSSALLWREASRTGAVIAIVLLALLPAAALATHAIDARKGIFLLPTIYAIPLAFATGLLLWLVALLAFVI